MAGPRHEDDRIDLRAPWRARPADDATTRTGPAIDLDDDGWPELAVPGHWRDHPDFADAEGPLLYRHRFELDREIGPDDRWWLVLDGVMAQSEVWLDAGYLGPTEGYFTPHSFEVTDPLRDRDEHVVAIEVGCPPPGDRSRKRLLTGALQDSELIDPAWNPGGIWRPVRLERTGPVRIERLRLVCRRADSVRAELRFRARLHAAAPLTVRLRTLVDGAASTTGIGDVALTETEHELAEGENHVDWRMTIDEPALWWPRALGDQPLHDVRVEAVVDGELSHLRKRRTGLRRVELDNWEARVNGERLYLKGAILPPSKRSIADVTEADVHADLDLALTAGLDLVRVHTHVARPELYRRADEVGLLVWQDLPMARGMARGTRKGAARQAEDLVDLLGHHPSILLWCGHDEPDGRTADPGVLAEAAGRRRRRRRDLVTQELPSWNRTVLDRSVARALRGADSSRPVIPHSGVLPHPPQLAGTDTHLWLGWEAGDEAELGRLAATIPRIVRFVGAFGAQAVPTTDDFCEPDRWPELDWAVLSSRHGLRRALLERREPMDGHETLASWARATQRSQADLVRHYVETLRRLKYRPSGGFCVHCLVDPQPLVSTSLVDHERVPKLAFDALREACRPVVILTDALPASLPAGERLRQDVHVVSDLRSELIDVEAIAELDVDGEVTTWRWTGDIAPDSVSKVGTIDHRVPADGRELRLRLVLRTEDEVVERHDQASLI
ncbi:MAG: hypothetical protein AAGA99_15200 [Actinomycetota bacterium]